MAVHLSHAARELLASAQLAHVVTMNRNHSPQVSCVWVRLDGDDVIFGSLGEWHKIQNLQVDHQVAISIEAPKQPGEHMQQYLVLYGTATIEEGGAPELLQELAHTYIGPDVKFPPFDDPPPGVVVRIAIDRVSGMGHWTD